MTIAFFVLLWLFINLMILFIMNSVEVSIITSKVSNKFFYNVEICQNNMWQPTVISKSTMAECLLTLAKKLKNREEIMK